MILLFSIYVIIQLISLGVLIAFFVLEGEVLPPPLAGLLPARKAAGIPYLNLAPALKVRKALQLRAKEKEALEAS
jgi:hypothetical protein